MGRYGFDLDGTLDSSPELAHLARALALAGHKIWIITGSPFSKKAIAAKLYGLNVVDYQKIITVDGTAGAVAIGKAKGEVCNKHDIDLFFDNNPKVLDGFAAVSKAARCYILSGDVLQPKVTPAPKRSLCRCQVDDREFREGRCMHCTAFLETLEQRLLIPGTTTLWRAMARYGFDLDGTLWMIPGVTKLARDLIDDGHKVYIITGNPSKDEIWKRLNELQLNPHKIIQVSADDLHEKGEQKGHAANKHKLSIFFEDKQDVMVGFAGTSRIARGYTPNDENMQPAKRELCVCQRQTGDFSPSRCFHCREHLESAEERADHSRQHHEDTGHYQGNGA